MSNILRLQTLTASSFAEEDKPESGDSISCSDASWLACGNCD